VKLALPSDLQGEVEAVLEDWSASNKVARLWEGDATLWTGRDESRWLGWLNVAGEQLGEADALRDLAQGARADGLEHGLLLGMGGSSLAPEVLAETFRPANGGMTLHVLDSTDPAQVRAAQASVDLGRTLFFVSSKSGSTLEPNVLKKYFMAQARDVLGNEAARRFVAITDPGSALEREAHADGFRAVLHGRETIGGRYSALSNFGMAPGAFAGVDVVELLERARRAAEACSPGTSVEANPGMVLGAALGVCALAGRDKLTIVTSPAIGDFGAWLEQLLAESTGKDGKGVIPVDAEPLGSPESYGEDRVFAYLRLSSEPAADQDGAIAALQDAGHPVVRIDVPERLDLGAQFFVWEFATAVVGALLGVNPFDQPDVEASKVKTRELTDQYEQMGELPEEEPILEEAGLSAFADERNADALGVHTSLDALLCAHLGRVDDGDYVALLPYLQRSAEHQQALRDIRAVVRDRTRAATCVGFGPRFLHSTGQAYKGGPNTGVFLQITCDDVIDLAIPGNDYSFGVVKAAQARGDLAVLGERGRRALRLHIGLDVEAGLRSLGGAVTRALSA
jgi:transaldolase / glucose-6-phosphate isomerase